ncbi:MAG: helix-turn-helix domain-containing protein [Clostridia bacterium]|nr:helix-turn-helix domain-containing protein [Clostridia bacterium]
MDIQSNISNNIKKYRKELGLSQEALADKLGITSQAVSKWECMQSIPDIEAIVELCTLFGIATDKLILDKEPEVVIKEVVVEKEVFVEKEPEKETSAENISKEDESERYDSANGEHFNRKGFFRKRYFDALPDDGELRILQFKGRLMLSEDTYDKNAVINLAIDPELSKKKTINVRIVGNAKIDGDISGNVNVGDHLNCGSVSGNAKAGDSVNCGNVGGSVHAGDSVNCGTVGGSVTAGDGVGCGNVNGNVVAGDSVRCGDVKVIQRCGGNIYCKSIQNCSGSVHINSDN